MTSSSRDVSVAPSEIRTFSAVLDDLNSLLSDVRSRISTTSTIDFGEYANSGGTNQRYREAVTQRTNALNALIATSERFADGTAQLAKDYDTISELNTALASEITQALDKGEE